MKAVELYNSNHGYSESITDTLSTTFKNVLYDTPLLRDKTVDTIQRPTPLAKLNYGSRFDGFSTYSSRHIDVEYIG